MLGQDFMEWITSKDIIDYETTLKMEKIVDEIIQKKKMKLYSY